MVRQFDSGPAPSEIPQSYFKVAQTHRSSESAIYVPTNVGVLLREGQKAFVFSNYGSSDPNNITVWQTDANNAVTLETSGVIFCGVIHAELSNGKLLIHAYSPEQLKALLEYAGRLLGQSSERLTANATLSFFPDDQTVVAGQTYESVVSNTTTVRHIEDKTQLIEI